MSREEQEGGEPAAGAGGRRAGSRSRGEEQGRQQEQRGGAGPAYTAGGYRVPAQYHPGTLPYRTPGTPRTRAAHRGALHGYRTCSIAALTRAVAETTFSVHLTF